jgi:hypothetical protein
MGPIQNMDDAPQTPWKISNVSSKVKTMKKKELGYAP